MTRKFILAAAIGVLLGAPLAPAFAGPGRPTGQARSSVNQPPARGGNYNGAGNNRQGGNYKGASNNRQGGGGNKVNVGNNVNVNTNGNGRNGYNQNYNNGRNGYNQNYNNGRRDVVVVGNNGGNNWDNNDNDFLEFVGKTAAITAGASIVAAVIKDKPDNCQPVMSGGVQYQSCNGILYQQVQGGYQQVQQPMPY